MAITGSGPISFSNLQTEFGGSNPISLSEYYRGGSYTTSNNTGVPTTGAISLSQFYSTTAADYIPTAFNINNVSVSGTTYAVQDSNTVTITGITTAISLTIDTTDANVNTTNGATTLTVYALVNAVEAGSITWTRSTNGSSTAISRSMSISVSNNDTLTISADVAGSGISAGSGGGGATISIKNASSSNTVLDTLTILAAVDWPDEAP
jgi:hypothetical protein